jgi:fatty-acyl-CoA synthase
MLTVDRMLRDRARTTPNRVAIVEGAWLWTYGELDERSDALARGLARGQRVSTLTGNTAEHVAVFFACAKAGAMLHPISWRLSPAEVAYQLDDAEPAYFLVEDQHRELGEAALAQAAVEPAQALPSNGPMQGQPGAADEDGLLLIYTSGTTGKPKGAVLTHANCFWTNLSFDRIAGLGADDVVLQLLPQFHVGGWNVQPLLAWWKGARVVLEREFEPVRALELIERKRVTTLMGVPATYLFMAQAPGFADADLSSLRTAVVGGAPMPVSLLEAWRERGVEIAQGYGLTEAAPNVLCVPPDDAVRKAGFAGRPYPHVDVRLGAGGELQVKGPNVFAGYWRDPEATEAAFDDGWLRTGDVAEQDEEGFVRIVGRLKDMYISGGENVYPAEVEAALHEHDAVADAAVVGVRDERWGEVGVAFVVLRRDASTGEEQLVAHCRERLARFKVPSRVVFLDELPRTGAGKVPKQELAALLEGVRA